MASPVDLVEYPIGQPLNETPAFFRLSSIDMVHRNLDVLDATWAAIKSDVTELVDSSARLCELEVKEEVAIGTLPELPVADPPAGESSEFSGSSGSGGAATCPEDAVDALQIVESTDPEFPAGMLLAPLGIDANCVRSWEATSGNGYVLTLRTCLLTHVVLLRIEYGDQLVTGLAGMSHIYGAMLPYAYDSTHEHSIRIAGA